MSARLAFVDDPASLARVPEGFAVVAVDPLVAIAAPEALSLDAHLDDLELERLGAETHERVHALCKLIDARAGGEPSAAWRFEALKMLYDGLLWRTLGATRLLAAQAPAEIELLLRPGSLASLALSHAVGRPFAPARSTSTPSRRSGRARAALTGFRRRLRRGRPRILCVDERYSLPAIAAELRERGADVMLWLPPPAAPQPVSAPDLSAAAPLFTIAGVDLWPAAREWLEAFVACVRPQDEAALAAARKAIRRDRPDALLASTFAGPAAKAAAAAAREAGIPTIVARHGELAIRQLPVMVHNDLDVVDHVLCWGEWEARFCERYAPRPVATAVVGAPMIEDAVAAAPDRAEVRRRFGLPAEERIVLLAPTSLSGDEWFLGHRAPVDLAYVRHLIALVESLLGVPGVRVVVKEHAVGPGPLETWARGRALPLTFLHGVPFGETIHLADATVLDFPSTTLVQALHGSAHLYVVRHPVTAWEPGVLEHLERHGVRAGASAELVAALAADVDAGRLDTLAAFPREAREPLLASGSGSAAERAAETILHIVSEQPRTTIGAR